MGCWGISNTIVFSIFVVINTGIQLLDIFISWQNIAFNYSDQGTYFYSFEFFYETAEYYADLDFLVDIKTGFLCTGSMQDIRSCIASRVMVSYAIHFRFARRSMSAQLRTQYPFSDQKTLLSKYDISIFRRSMQQISGRYGVSSFSESQMVLSAQPSQPGMISSEFSCAFGQEPIMMSILVLQMVSRIWGSSVSIATHLFGYQLSYSRNT